MAAFAIALLDGLSYASTLFLMASGLTLIFGVTRIVNFARGSFFMLGALFAAHWLVGAIAEWLVLRRLYGVPELYQLVATFGLSLALHDAMR
jgi:branched-chain amino acid transport system permease protein